MEDFELEPEKRVVLWWNKLLESTRVLMIKHDHDYYTLNRTYNESYRIIYSLFCRFGGSINK